MKKALTAAVVAGVLLAFVPVFAEEQEGREAGEWCGCYGPGMHMGGPGMHMWGGPGMYKWGYGPRGKEGRKFLDETVDLRRQMHAKEFEYREAWRLGEEKKARELEKELYELGKKLNEKAGEAGLWRGYPGMGYGPGMMWY